MEAAALRVEDIGKGNEACAVCIREYKDALAAVVIRRRIRGDGAMEWLCFIGEGGGLAGGAPAGQAGHAGNSSLGYCHGFDGKSKAVSNAISRFGSTCTDRTFFLRLLCVQR